MISLAEGLFYAEAEGLLDESTPVEFDEYGCPYLPCDVFYSLTAKQQQDIGEVYPDLYVTFT